MNYYRYNSDGDGTRLFNRAKDFRNELDSKYSGIISHEFLRQITKRGNLAVAEYYIEDSEDLVDLGELIAHSSVDDITDPLGNQDLFVLLRKPKPFFETLIVDSLSNISQGHDRVVDS